MENGKNIYKNIKNEMKKQRINQSDIARILGMTRANVSLIFSRMKKNKISYKNTIKIAAILGVNPKNFF
ncbi:MAG: helix-turn-helix domain-containing protein [Cetobacterium sp.]|nr:helix-turn-helix domain-containing protein [Cetobacterium sp.]